jgi:hypothetical protein
VKKSVFWDVVPCRYWVNRSLGGTYRLHLQGRRKKKIRERGTSVIRCWQTNFLLFSTLKMKAIRSSETSVNTLSTLRHIPEDGILHSHGRENLKSYKILTNARSKPNREVSALFIRSRLRDINCSGSELKMFVSLWGLWLVSECYQIVALKDAVPHRGKGTGTPPFCPSRRVFKEIPRGNVS